MSYSNSKDEKTYQNGINEVLELFNYLIWININ